MDIYQQRFDCWLDDRILYLETLIYLEVADQSMLHRVHLFCSPHHVWVSNTLTTRILRNRRVHMSRSPIE